MESSSSFFFFFLVRLHKSKSRRRREGGRERESNALSPATHRSCVCVFVDARWKGNSGYDSSAGANETSVSCCFSVLTVLIPEKS